jgi:NAD(P)-dependent dehydrogenase (short-subunit alcohol dehydrogenase family)
VVAVVTGAAQGIGRSVAETLGAEGYALALIDLREPAETLASLRTRAPTRSGLPATCRRTRT